ncbi:hypothetical protein PbDSM24746_20760 [Paenibacillus macerans]|nr:hypothetical protein PbDSM24746_20760 [Paenibacillus macerans]GBK68380.1 hypothetical protein PbJCM17693_20880 [Paenibacillus macerans]
MADQPLHAVTHRAEGVRQPADFVHVSNPDFLGQIARGHPFRRMHQRFMKWQVLIFFKLNAC